jgi:hypothetical protein
MKPIFALTILAALAAPLTLSACGKAVSATGFIPRNVRMAKEDDLTQRWRSAKASAASFGKVVVLPVETPEMGAYGDLDAEQLATCRSVLATELTKAFASPPGTGDRTLYIHAAITAIKPNKPLLNVAPQTQLLKRGYGYAACEIYATDGEMGPIVAAFMQTQDTARFGTEKLSSTGTAEKAAGEWATQFRELVGK